MRDDLLCTLLIDFAFNYYFNPLLYNGPVFSHSNPELIPSDDHPPETQSGVVHS